MVAPNTLVLSELLSGLEQVKAELVTTHAFLQSKDVQNLALRLQQLVASGQPYDTYEALFSNGWLFDADPQTLPDMLIAVLGARHVLADMAAATHRFAELNLCTGVPLTGAKVLYGQIVVDGDLLFDDRLVVVGDLHVGGVIEATNDCSALFVAGDVRARGINCYPWCGSVIVGGGVYVNEVLAFSQNLAAGGLVQAPIILEGDGVWAIRAALETDLHLSYEEIEEGVEGPLGETFASGLLAGDSLLADDHAFIRNLFDALKRGESIRR